jgi:ATP-dependent helicase/nuclease subunit B
MKLVVVPDSDRVEQWVTDAARSSRFIDARAICTVGQLVERCEPARWSGRAPADPLQVRLILAAHASLAERAFGALARTPDFAAQVQEVIAHLRAQNITPRQLSTAAEGVDDRLAARTHALATLWNRLDETLQARGLVDRGELVRLAATRLRTKGLPPRLRGFSEFELRHVHDLFPARLDLFEALANACGKAGVGLQLWWPSSGQQQVDLFVLDAVRSIEAGWQTLSAEAFADQPLTSLSWVAPAAFGEAAVGAHPAPTLTTFSAPTVRDEARQIAARVKTLISAGTPPERIAIAFRALADDTESLVEALADLDVPARARLGVPLLASEPGRLALGLFDLLEDGFPADDFAALLESRSVSIVPHDAAGPRRAFLEAGVRDDLLGATPTAGAYRVRLEGLERRQREPRRGAIAKLRAAVEDVLRLVRQIPHEGSATELLESWWDCLTKLGLFASSASRPEPLLTSDALLRSELNRALARDQAAGEALLGLLASLREALRASGLGPRRMSRRDFARSVRRAAKDLNLVARGPRTGAVWLLDARELAGRRFDVLFFGGLVDGRFPGRAPTCRC